MPVEGEQEAIDVERVDVVDLSRNRGVVGPRGGVAGELEPAELHVAAEGHAEGKLTSPRVGLQEEEALRGRQVGGWDVAGVGDAGEAGGDRLIDELLHEGFLGRVFKRDRVLEIPRLLDLRLGHLGGLLPCLARLRLGLGRGAAPGRLQEAGQEQGSLEESENAHGDPPSKSGPDMPVVQGIRPRKDGLSASPAAG